jgi:thymidylate synthase (FAD)
MAESNVKLVGITQPKLDNMTPTQFIAYMAKVSNPTKQTELDTPEKLINYCIKNKHWSIFEMVNVVLEISTTRDIGRQILRHRSFSFQEFSQRYATPNFDDFTSKREARLQDTKNRQNSIETDDAILQDRWEQIQKNSINEAIENYQWAMEHGIAKEVARAILPEGLTPTRMYMNGTLRSWIHYCQLRMGNGTQKEHQEIAKQAWEVLKQEFGFLKTLEQR